MLRRILVALLVALALPAGATGAWAQTTSSSTPPDPGLGIRLLEIPEARQDDPRAQSYIIDHVAPGSRFERTIEVSNGSDRPLEVSLYTGAASLDDGVFAFGAPGETNELSGWVSAAPATVTLGPGQRQKVAVAVAVPPTAQAGERYGVVWAETPGEAPAGGGLAVNTRVGIRLYLSVGPGAEPGTDFSLETFEPRVDDDGAPVVVIATCNKGGRAIDLSGDVALADGPGGTSAGPFATATTRTFAPGECGDVTVELADGLPRGPWEATAALRSGEVERTASARITFPDKPGRGEKVPAERVLDSAGGRTALFVAVGLLLLVVVALVTWQLRRRRSPA